MPILFAVIALQLACAVHCVRSGRNQGWLMLVLFLPVLGSLAYVVIEVLPGYRGHRTVRKVQAKAVRTLDPERDLRRAREQLETADTAANHAAFADALAGRAIYAEAIKHYEIAEQKAPGGRDRPIRLKLIKACFETGQTKRARTLLAGLPPTGTQSEQDKASLLLARMLEAGGESARALVLYADIGPRLPGAEAQCREAGLLLSLGRRGEALAPLVEAEKRAKRMDRHEKAKDADMYAWAVETLAELRAEGLG